ncbi:hypothetical protein POTOM_005150 [Populus tomentosa]|uniref:HMA domain-containing protein n=1 Tax=Populus tomentosa TaxID=118781 RepID=A0A8X8D6B1_POPTO|nr:hypothetical protein POTOM_005150 [Populus tomentosa]
MDSALAISATALPLFTLSKVNRHFITHNARSFLRHSSSQRGTLRLSSICSHNNDARASSPFLCTVGMTCGGCASSVKRILESQPQVSSASVNLATESAIVWPVSEAKGVPNWQKQLGEALAKHLTSCGFMSNLRGKSQQLVVDWLKREKFWCLGALEDQLLHNLNLALI